VTQQFLRQNTLDFIAADKWALYPPDFNPLDYCLWDILQDFVYEGRRLPFANLQNLKEAIKNKWKKVTIETVRKSTAQCKNNLLRLESRMEALIAVNGYRCYAVRRVALAILYSSDTQYSFAYFTVKTIAYNIIISHIVHL